jgi:hypothetical protein
MKYGATGMACTDVATTKAKITAINLIMFFLRSISGCRNPGVLGATAGGRSGRGADRGGAALIQITTSLERRCGAPRPR